MPVPVLVLLLSLFLETIVSSLPADHESGAQSCAAFFEYILTSAGSVHCQICGVDTRHPTKIHEEFGGSEIPVFRKALATFLMQYASQVFRVAANDFVLIGLHTDRVPIVFSYRGIESLLLVRDASFTVSPPVNSTNA